MGLPRQSKIPSNEIRRAGWEYLQFPALFCATSSAWSGGCIPDATPGSEIPIISQIDRILNNRCRKW
jgi:hypothetical protein